MDQADVALRCIDGPLAAPDVVTWFQLSGLTAFLDGDKTRARDAFRAALAVLPGATHVIQVGKREFAQVTVRSRGG